MKQKKHAPHKPWTDARKHEALRLYETGLSIAVVAEALETSDRHVGRVLRSFGIVRSKRQMYLGSGNPCWRGGRRVDKSGYVLLYTPEHPAAMRNGCVREHRLVMEKALGRHLTRREVVHHRDGDPVNNAIENLVLFSSNGEHLRDELTGCVPNWSEEGYARMKEAAARKKEAALRRRRRS